MLGWGNKELERSLAPRGVCLYTSVLAQGRDGQAWGPKCAERPLGRKNWGNTLVLSLPLLLQALVLSQQLLDMKNKRQFILHHLSCRQGRNKDEVCRAGLKSSLSNSLQWWRPTYFSVWREEGWGGRVRGINRTWSQRCHLLLRVQDFLLGDSCAGGNGSLTDSCSELELPLLLGGMAQNQTHQKFPWLK